MMKSISLLAAIAGITWWSLWFTPDQQGQRLMNRGEFRAAAETFRDPMRQGVAWFRAGEFEKAEQAFARSGTEEAEFNRGNCLVMLGKYEPAIERYDRALELDPDFEDARINRDVAIARAKLVERKGGDMGDQKVGADEITFDKAKNTGGQDTETEAEPAAVGCGNAGPLAPPHPDRPADFLKSKFAYQLCSRPADRRRQVMKGLIRPWVMLCCICLPSVSAAAEIVRAEIGKEDGLDRRGRPAHRHSLFTGTVQRYRVIRLAQAAADGHS